LDDSLKAKLITYQKFLYLPPALKMVTGLFLNCRQPIFIKNIFFTCDSCGEALDLI